MSRQRRSRIVSFVGARLCHAEQREKRITYICHPLQIRDFWIISLIAKFLYVWRLKIPIKAQKAPEVHLQSFSGTIFFFVSCFSCRLEIFKHFPIQILLVQERRDISSRRRAGDLAETRSIRDDHLPETGNRGSGILSVPCKKYFRNCRFEHIQSTIGR